MASLSAFATAVRTNTVHVQPVKGFTSAESLLDAWGSSLNRGDLEAVLACFHEEAMVLPTFSSRMLKGQKEIAAYKRNLIAEGTQVAESGRLLVPCSAGSVNIIVSTVWKKADGAGLAGRASFTCVEESGIWRITLLHSSLNPSA